MKRAAAMFMCGFEPGGTTRGADKIRRKGLPEGDFVQEYEWKTLYGA
jgi:hypothetical protein